MDNLTQAAITKVRRISVVMLVAIVMIFALTGFITSDGRDLQQESADSEEATCPDLLGTWSATNIEVMTVFNDGSHRLSTTTSSELEITEQHGCVFQATNTWENDLGIGGVEHVGGVMDATTGSIIITEAPSHPDGGTTAQFHARLISENQMGWEYIGMSSDREAANVFTAIHARDGEAPEHEACADLNGIWRGRPFDVVNLFVDGTVSDQLGTSNELEVLFQSDCKFSAINSWSNGEYGGSEFVAGVIDPSGDWITMKELGTPPEGGTSGHIRASLLDTDHIAWDYIGMSRDGNKVQAFSTSLTRAEEPQMGRAKCPDLIGTWEAQDFESIRVTGEGAGEILMGTIKTITIEAQRGCEFSGSNSISVDGKDTREAPIAGVVNAETGWVIVLEAGEHPSGSMPGFVIGRMVAENEIDTEYIGTIIGDGTDTIEVFAARLIRQ